jgi:hypothetical protein
MESTTVTATEPTVHVIVLAKYSKRALTPEVRDTHLSTILATVNNKRNALLGWHMERRTENGKPLFRAEKVGGRDLHNEAPFNVWMDREVTDIELDNVVRNFNSADAVNSEYRWHVYSVDGETYEGDIRDNDEQSSGKNDIKDLLPYSEVSVPENWEEFFTGGKNPVIGLEAHTSRMMRPLRVAIGTDWEERHNTLLVGVPACGKSELMRRLKRMVGNDAVLEVDATSTTAKGLQDILAEKSIMPRVLLVEEIEKGSKELHEVLLSIMDTRGEIRKVTARGKIMQECRMVTICTANDMEKFRNSASGAIASRTDNVIYFQAASRATMYTIVLNRMKNLGLAEVKAAQIVNKVLDYAEGTDMWDTRSLISLAQCGGEDWLNGEYEKELAATAPREKQV